MKTFSINNIEREDLLKRLRNHRILIITIIYLIAAPVVPNKLGVTISSIPLVYISSWVFWMILLFIAMDPRRSILKDFTIEFKENYLVINTCSKKPKIIHYKNLGFIGKTKFGIQLYSGFITRVWIPSIIINFEEVNQILDEKVPRKFFNPIRNPIFLYLFFWGAYILIMWNQFSLVMGDVWLWVTIYITNVIYFLFYE